MKIRATMDFPNKSKFLISFVEILLTNLLLFNFSSKCLCCLKMLCMSITPTCTEYMHKLLTEPLDCSYCWRGSVCFSFCSVYYFTNDKNNNYYNNGTIFKIWNTRECVVCMCMCLCLFVDIYRMFLMWACLCDTMFTISYCIIFNHNNLWMCLLCSVPSCYVILAKISSFILNDFGCGCQWR